MKWSKPSLRTRVGGGWLFLVGCVPLLLLNEVMSRLGKHVDRRNDRLKKQNESKRRQHGLVWKSGILVFLNYSEDRFPMIFLLHMTPITRKLLLTVVFQ